MISLARLLQVKHFLWVLIFPNLEPSLERHCESTHHPAFCQVKSPLSERKTPHSSVRFLPVSTTDLVSSTPIMESTPPRRTRARMPPPLLQLSSTPFMPGPTRAFWASSRVEEAPPTSTCVNATVSFHEIMGSLWFVPNIRILWSYDVVWLAAHETILVKIG